MANFLCILVLGGAITWCVFEVVQIVRAIKERKKAKLKKKEVNE